MHKIRIKDIAERAGVSVGTVDRVLHNRPNVSAPARKRVEQALKEMEYKPNAYASALAYNREYTFVFLLPMHASEAYWEEIEEGALKAVDAFRDFHVNVKTLYYQRFNDTSFEQTVEECISSQPDGVIVVPTRLELTRAFTDQLHELNIPFVMLDSYMPDLRPLAFYGQDSFSSGYFAAKVLMLIGSSDKEVMLLRLTKGGQLSSKQQGNREVGFRHYMRDHFPQITICEVNLPLEGERSQYDMILDRFFEAHPSVHNCITFGSKAHIVGEYLLRTNRRNVQIMGYDMVHKNADCLRQGSISFLIAQHAYMQGYYCVDALFKAIVLKSEVKAVNYMPIELLCKENVDYYQRTMI
jgi:LacI family transcriptional regulator